MVENSHQFFVNKECKYYPCHEEIEQINCLFCYCPLYQGKSCPGQCRYIENAGGMVKDCSGCIYPHLPDNYEKIVRILEQQPI